MKLESIISERGLVQQAPEAAAIRAKTAPITLFYGETYDDKGHPIDSMKYYLFVARLARALEEEGRTSEPTIMIGDVAAARNVSKGQEGQAYRLGKERVLFAKRINDIYGTNLNIQLMSERMQNNYFKETLDEVMRICNEDDELHGMVEQSVPESKRDIEREKGFMYSFDEIASIVHLDIKIGPPREDLYDRIARAITSKQRKPGLLSIYLTPTFPVGMQWDYFFANEGIEEHGITAYKAGSKKLQRNRILVGQSRPEHVISLLGNTFISTNPRVPNPTLDIAIIAEMARQQLERSFEPITLAESFYSGKLSGKELQEQTANAVDKYVLSLF